ncbi:MAG: hypothetical protein Q8Q35_02245 [Nanoarchaeota archaeon]|nr:hypothetical protein [Nanoarchaeota archaeon]
MANKVVELKENILVYVQKNGPLLPQNVAKHFKGTNMFISALLSELVTNKKVKMSKAKVGGSPLYYCEHQREQLYSKLRNYVGPKPKEALDNLNDKKVLRDRDCLPFERVALRELVDFAKPVRLIIGDTEELFWKWYLLPDFDAKLLIEDILRKVYSQEEEPAKKIILEKPIIEIVEPKVTSNHFEIPINQEIPVIEISMEEKAEKLKLIRSDIKILQKKVENKPEPVIQKPKVIEEPEIKQPIVIEEPKIVKPKKNKAKKKVDDPTTVPEAQTTLSYEIEEPQEDEFFDLVKANLDKKGIIIKKFDIIKSSREFNFVVKIPSNVGELNYFVKARNRKKLNEGDVLLAFTESQNFKMPLLYFSNADLTNKAMEYIEKNLPGMTFIKLE